jgi:hypothetical protein
LLNLLYVSRGETNFQKMTYLNLTWTFEKTGICRFFVYTEKRSSISNRIFYHNNRGILILDNVNFRAEKVRNLKLNVNVILIVIGIFLLHNCI